MKLSFYTTLLLLLICAGNSHSQSLEPVKWSFALSQENGKIKVTAKALIDKGWDLYSMTTYDDGPIPTSIHFNDEIRVIKIQESGDLIEQMSPLFMTTVKKYKGELQLIAFIEPNQDKSISGYVNFMTCDGNRCLPPQDVEFNLRLK